MNISRHRRLLGVWVALGLGAALPSYALENLNGWRFEVTQVRQLADNSGIRAYDKALRLQRSLPANADPADQALILNLLARIEITLARTEEAARHAQQALDLAKQHGDRIGQLEADLNIALNSVNQGDIPALVAATTQSVELLDGVDRPDLVGEAFLRTAMMYRRLGQIDESITMCMQAMDIAERTNNPLALLYAHQGLGISYSQSNHYELAREHFAEMLNQARIAHSSLMEAYALTSLAGTLAQFGDRENAEADFRAAIGLYRAVGTPVGLSYGLFGLAAHLRDKGDSAAALSIFNEIMTIYRRYPNRIGLWFTLNARSDVLKELGQRAEAQANAEEASSLADAIGLALYRTESRQRLGRLAAAAGDYQRAYRLATEAAQITTQASEEKISTRVIEMAQRYRSASEQRQIDELTSRNQQQTESLRQRRLQLYRLVALLSVSATALIGLSWLVVHLRRSRNVLADINSRLRQSQENLADTTNRLESLIDNMPGSVFRIVRPRKGLPWLDYFSGKPHDLTELSPEGLKNRIHPDDWPDLYEDAYGRLLAAQQTEYRFRIQRGNGGWRWNWVREKIVGWDGDTMILEGVSLDITEEMEAKLALERQEAERRRLDEQLFETRRLQELGQLAGGIAHDFNNLLGAILGFTHFILEDAADDDPAKSHARHIRAAGLRGKGIIQKILSFAQGKAPSRSRFGLVDLVRETLDLLRASIPATTHFILAVGEEDAVVDADYDQIGQALLNLCINAHDALGGNPGTVTVAIRTDPLTAVEHGMPARSDTASRAGAMETWRDDAGYDWAGIGNLAVNRDHVFLAVSDDGAGMNGDLLKRIFTPFFSTKARNRGTGLGLSVVRDVVLANDGAMTVRSRPGSGTCFTLAIPRGWDEDEAADESAASAAEAGPCRILMVDDDPDFGAMMRYALERRGVAVTYFANPPDALEAARKGLDAWDAVLTDYIMPEMTGTDLIRAIKALDETMPCILCTGYSKDLTSLGMQEVGVAALIEKPGDIGEAVSLVMRIATSRGEAR